MQPNYERSYGYNDSELVASASGSRLWKALAIAGALLLIVSIWFALNQKLLFGEQWISATYDNDDWRTNEGALPTYGAWDFEAHVWKTEYIIKYFPNFNWNPYWYLGMPLLEYYQPMFYFVHAGLILLTGFSAAKSALLLVVFGHLLATILTFLLCYKLSRKVWISALCSLFLLSNTFTTLRSYGWEPITVVFLFLYPLGLLFFFREPLKPFRASLIITLAAAYLAHPLQFFSLIMTMGIYLAYIAVKDRHGHGANSRYLLQFAALVAASLLLSGVQFIPQMAYQQVTSGTHMGVKYLPFYQVPYNIITPFDFFFDAGNLKGPGPIVMISAILLVLFAVMEFRRNRHGTADEVPYAARTIRNHELVVGLAIVLFIMVLFYYLERFNIFPMNVLRAVQYHRIIPEFVITAAALLASMSNIARATAQKAVYQSMLFAFVVSSGILVYNVQERWDTYADLSSRPEFIHDSVEGRISFPYTDQSLAVRSSFSNIPQAYGYYEQGITNLYDDEIFSVSSGFHNATFTILYLKAANVGRLYVNIREGRQDQLMMGKLNATLPLVANGSDSRYGYFEIPLKDPSFAQAVDSKEAGKVKKLEPGCRVMFMEKYCGSAREEFVSNDLDEIRYLAAYVALLEKPYASSAGIEMKNPEHYAISVRNASAETAVVVKMTYDKNFRAHVNGTSVPIKPFGPYFMLIEPRRQGDYVISLDYGMSKPRIAGILFSGATAAGLVMLNFVGPGLAKKLRFREGDLK